MKKGEQSVQKIVSSKFNIHIWKHPSLSEVTPIMSNMELAHFGSETCIYNENILAD